MTSEHVSRSNQDTICFPPWTTILITWNLRLRQRPPQRCPTGFLPREKNYHPWDFSRGVGLRCLRIVRFNLKCYSTSSNSTSAHLCRVKLRLMPSLALSWSERRDSSLIVSVYVMTMMTSGPKNAASDPYTMKYELNTYDTEQGTMRKKKTSIGSDWC